MARTPTYPSPGPLERALDLLFPPVCVGCSRVGRWICERCWQVAPWALDGGCVRCGAWTEARLCRSCGSGVYLVTHIDAVMLYEGIGKEAVETLKFRGRFAIKDLMGRLLAAAVQTGPDVVVPVPLHRARRRARGYDQARMLARVAAAELGVRYDDGTLTRTRRTRQQATLGKEERESNVQGAFTAGENLAGQRVLLVDDVFTTGATMEAAARALRAAGVVDLKGAAFARAVTPSNQSERPAIR